MRRALVAALLVFVASRCLVPMDETDLFFNLRLGEIVLATHDDPTRYDTFLNLRVADIHALYDEWRGRGAEFLTPPLDNHGYEMRCYMRDPDGRIIEVGQATGFLDVIGATSSQGQ